MLCVNKKKKKKKEEERFIVADEYCNWTLDILVVSILPFVFFYLKKKNPRKANMPSFIISKKSLCCLGSRSFINIRNLKAEGSKDRVIRH
jgi:sugar phosphate permease